MSANLRILLADDHDVVRRGLRALIENQVGWEVCGVATNGREALDLAKELEPDIIILDMTMPELSGVDAVRRIRRAAPKSEILVLSGHHAEDVIVQVFEAGAMSYIQKADAGRHLISAIQTLAQHKRYFTPEISEIVFHRIVGKSVDNSENPVGNTLTAREREIVLLLADGKSNKEVATQLGISIRTAETHRAALMKKLGLTSLAALVRYAVRNNIIEA